MAECGAVVPRSANPDYASLHPGYKATRLRAPRVVSSSQCQTAQSFVPAARRLRPGCCFPLRTRPEARGGRSAGRRVALTCRAGKARRHACEAWAVPRNRDAASRRSTVALSAQDRAFRLRHCRRVRREGCSRPGTRASPAVPGFPCPRLRAAVDATPRSAFRIVSGRRPSISEDDEIYYGFG